MSGASLRIGQLARQAGVTTDTLRYYERLGLIAPARRTAGGYRQYDPSAAQQVAFVHQAQALGLSLAEIREVVRMAAAGARPCAEVRAILQGHLRAVDGRIAALRSLRRTLARALATPAGERAEARVCGIIESQAVAREPPGRRAKEAS